MHRKIAFPILLAFLLVAVSALFGASTQAAQHHAKKRATTHKKSVHAKRTRAVVRTQHRTTRRRYHRRRRRYRGQRAPTSERISEIQQALAKNGAFTGSPDGKWGPATVEAMKKFQSSNGLNATGKLDARTLQKLGLGSQIAGIAPPLPPSGSSALGDEPTEAARQ